MPFAVEIDVKNLFSFFGKEKSGYSDREMGNKMIHLVIDGVIFGLQKSGGISRVWAEILLELDQTVAKSQRVTVLIPSNQNVEWKRISNQLSSIHIVKRKRFRWDRRQLFWESFYLTCLAFKLKPTLWQATFFVGFPRWGCPRRVACLYDMIPEILGFAKKYDSGMKYKTLKGACRTLVISRHSQKDLETYWPEFKGNTDILPMATSHFPGCLGLSHQPYFIYVGTRKGYKNALTVTKLLLEDSRFTSYSIWFVGGETQWSKEEEETFNTLGVWDRVTLKGILPLEELQRAISQAAALLFPSLYEGFGLPVLEAFQIGVPVLACRSSSIPEITGDEYPLADPQNPSTYGEILETLLQCRDHWIAYGKKREKLFTRGKMVVSLLNSYKELTRAI